MVLTHKTLWHYGTDGLIDWSNREHDCGCSINQTLVLAHDLRPSSSMTFSTLSFRCACVMWDGRRRAAEKWRFSRTDSVPITTSSCKQNGRIMTRADTYEWWSQWTIRWACCVWWNNHPSTASKISWFFIYTCSTTTHCHHPHTATTHTHCHDPHTLPPPSHCHHAHTATTHTHCHHPHTATTNTHCHHPHTLPPPTHTATTHTHCHHPYMHEHLSHLHHIAWDALEVFRLTFTIDQHSPTQARLSLTPRKNIKQPACRAATPAFQIS